MARLLDLKSHLLTERLSDQKRRFMVLMKDAPAETVEALRRLSRAWLGIQTAFVGGFEHDGKATLIAVWLDKPETRSATIPDSL